MGKGKVTTSTWHAADAGLVASLGAYCLDGSPPGFWYQSPPAPSAPGSARSWLVFLDGGAWCYDQHSCASRARGFKGTSKQSGNDFWAYDGYMAHSPAVNPTFSTFHRVHFHYCDGSSFSGDRAEPLTVEAGKPPLYFRGRRVLEALLKTALALGMNAADEVLFSGGSAGGIGALHAAHAAHAMMPHVKKFKVLILSGFFLERLPPRLPPAATASSPSSSLTQLPAHSASSSTLAAAAAAPIAADDSPQCHRGRGASDKCIPWVHKMRRMCDLHNCSAAVTAGGCGADWPAEQRWRCLFGRHAATHVTLPTFYINSAVDSWQMVNVWRRYARCRWDGDKTCTPSQTAADVAETNTMMRIFVRDLRGSGALARPGNGAFVYSCNEHVAGLMNGAFTGYKLAGTSMRDALAAWWADAPDAPTSRHLYLPCELEARANGSKGLAHNGCNPSCDAYKARRRLSQECPCAP